MKTYVKLLMVIFDLITNPVKSRSIIIAEPIAIIVVTLILNAVLDNLTIATVVTVLICLVIMSFTGAKGILALVIRIIALIVAAPLFSKIQGLSNFPKKSSRKLSFKNKKNFVLGTIFYGAIRAPQIISDALLLKLLKCMSLLATGESSKREFYLIKDALTIFGRGKYLFTGKCAKENYALCSKINVVDVFSQEVFFSAYKSFVNQDSLPEMLEVANRHSKQFGSAKKLMRNKLSQVYTLEYASRRTFFEILTTWSVNQEVLKQTRPMMVTLLEEVLKDAVAETAGLCFDVETACDSWISGLNHHNHWALKQLNDYLSGVDTDLRNIGGPFTGMQYSYAILECCSEYNKIPPHLCVSILGCSYAVRMDLRGNLIDRLGNKLSGGIQ